MKRQPAEGLRLGRNLHAFRLERMSTSPYLYFLDKQSQNLRIRYEKLGLEIASLSVAMTKIRYIA